MKKRLLMFSFVIALLLCPWNALTATEQTHEETQDAHANKGWVATDTYRVMNFVVLAALLVVLLRKPLSQALNARIRGIQDQLADLEKKKKEAEAQLAQYNERLLLLDREAERVIEEYIKQGNEAKARILQEAKVAAERIEEQARKTVAHEFEMAKEKLQAEIFDKALAKAEGIIKRNITPQDQERLVDEYLKEVEIQ
ncbi:MAG: F0F1 ATP synthase subunit B [Deltaproteobacteria bacterium]|nr:F0F1 ATP synthase subunit B [Deltaproteobacteria bacterium]